MTKSFNIEDINTAARMEHLAEEKPASELKEIATPKSTSFKDRMAALKAKMEADKKKPEEKPPVSVPSQVEIVPGDMGKPQNELEKLIEEDRQFGNRVIDKSLEKDTQKVLNAEALMSETLAEKSMDPERFKAVFANIIQTQCVGFTRAEIEESVRRDHFTLFDTRVGVQAKIAYRAEMLKDETAEERAKALKEDWLFKPNKKAASTTTKKSSKPKESTMDVMRKSIESGLRAKGYTGEELETRIKAGLKKLGM